MYGSSLDISPLLGGGEQDWLCENTLGDSCTACWSVNNVQIVDESIQSCYKLTVECDGALIFRNEVDLGCATAADCQGNIYFLSIIHMIYREI